MKYILALLIFFLSISKLFSQEPKRLVSTDSYVHIYSYTPIEDIEAFLNDGMAILDPEKRELAYVLNIQSLTFKNALMQEHFNENYMESDIFPTSTFVGKVISHKEDVANVEGKLTIHGESNIISVAGDLQVNDNVASISAVKFSVKLKDYKIKVPRIVMYNIAEEIEIKVNIEMKKQ